MFSESSVADLFYMKKGRLSTGYHRMRKVANLPELKNIYIKFQTVFVLHEYFVCKMSSIQLKTSKTKPFKYVENTPLITILTI